MKSTANRPAPTTRTSRLSQQLKVVGWAMRYEGVLFTVLRVIAKIPSSLGMKVASRGWFQQLAEKSFDRRFGVETSEAVTVENLDVPESLRGDAVEYNATSGAKFGCLLSDLSINYQEFVFVDFGSGKGKVLLMAADFPFDKIIGVELSASLSQVATENISRYRSRRQQCRDITAMCADATTFEYPDQPLLLYFFNPFSETILRKVVENIGTSLQKNPRTILIVYYNPQHEQVFRDSERFDRVELANWNDPMWSVYVATDSSEHFQKGT